MALRTPAIWLLVSLISSGCLAIGVESPGGDGAMGDGIWRTLESSAQGSAGEWMMLYHPLPNPTSTIAFHIEFEILAGEPEQSSQLWYLEPSIVADHGGRTHWTGFDRQGPGIRQAFGPFQHSVELTGYGGTTGQFLGVIFLMAADSDWAVSMNVTLLDQDGPTVSPNVLRYGNGTVFLGGAKHPLGLPSLPSGGAVLEYSTLQPGWTHAELIAKEIQPIRIRDLDLRFANGFALEGVQAMAGASTPSSSVRAQNFAGARVGTALNVWGENRWAATWLDAGWGVELQAVHLPGADSAWPFDSASADYATEPRQSFDPTPPMETWRLHRQA